MQYLSEQLYYTLRVFLLFFVVVSIGVIGFMWIEWWNFEDSLYMVIVTLSTIGYGETHALSSAGRWFNMAFIILSLWFAAYALSTFAAYIIEWDFRNFFSYRYHLFQIRRMQNHTILCGYGQVGRQIAKEFKKFGHDLCVIDDDIKAIEKAKKDGMITLFGDASQDEVLASANIQTAKTVIVATGSDAKNIFITLSVRHARPDVNIIARANEAEDTLKLYRAGATRVSLVHRISGYHIATMARHPAVIDFFDVMINGQSSLRIEEIMIHKKSPLLGTRCGDIFDTNDGKSLRLLVLFRKPNELENPVLTEFDDTTELQHDDRLILLWRSEHLEAFLNKQDS